MALLSLNALRPAVESFRGPDLEARRFARLARQALIAEAELTPKPGLVDRRGAGAHTDLSLDLLRRSADAIEPYFHEMAVVSQGAHPSQSIREHLAAIGRSAERTMFEATHGSNAHKGAIWALGLLVAALAMHERGSATPSAVATIAAEIASFTDLKVPRLVSHGDVVATRYGVAGARGEALAGFPHVLNVGLPMLRRRRRAGTTEEVARLDALLSIMARLDDTCLLYRGGAAALVGAKEGALAVEVAGGVGCEEGREKLRSLDRRLLSSNVSPGGSADLLAAVLFLDAVEYGQDDVQADRSLLEVSHGAH
jgi:triphosphoribosyl-dephospho-CoA synthase